MVEKYYTPPLKISFIIGITSITFNVIGYTIYSLINNDFSYFTDCFDFSKIKNKFIIAIYFIFYSFFSFALVLSLFLSIFYFSPNIITITHILRPLFTFIVKAIIYKAILFDIIFGSIGYLIAFFSFIIFNELIIFNCCGLNKNTKKFVNKRINLELEEIKNEENNLLSETDDDSLLINDNKEN